MAYDDRTGTQLESIVFTARYSRLKAWGSVVVAILLAILPWGAAMYQMLEEGAGDWTLVFPLLIVLGALWFAIDTLSFKELVFYDDRISEIRYLFGATTVYYSGGGVSGETLGTNLLCPQHVLHASTEDGRQVLKGCTISYVPFLFPSDTAKTIAKIWGYLSEDTINDCRVFKKARLPADGVWSSDSRERSASGLPWTRS